MPVPFTKIRQWSAVFFAKSVLVKKTGVVPIPERGSERCLGGHESTCVEFGSPTIQPGGFAERVVALAGWTIGTDGRVKTFAFLVNGKTSSTSKQASAGSVTDASPVQ